MSHDAYGVPNDMERLIEHLAQIERALALLIAVTKPEQFGHHELRAALREVEKVL